MERDVVVITSIVKKASVTSLDDGLEHRVGTLPAGTKLLTRGEIRAFDEVRTEAIEVFDCWGVHGCLEAALTHAHRQSDTVRVIRVPDVFPQEAL